MMGVAPKGTTMSQVSLSVVPYIIANLLLIAALVAYPGIVTFLPSLMNG